MSYYTLPLGEACSVITDGTHYTPKAQEIGRPFLTVKDMLDGYLDFENCSRISEGDFQDAIRNGCGPRAGDVLFSKDGTVGKVHPFTLEEDCAVLSSIAILRPKTEILDQGYFAHFLRSEAFLRKALRNKTGSAIRRIILANLRNLEIPLPPLEEQRRIAAILDKAENLRLLAHLSSRALASFKESVFLDMFGSPTQSFSPWPVLPLGEAARLENGDRSANYPSGHDIKEDGVLFLSTKNIVNNKLDLSKSAFITTNKFNSLTQGKARPGDLVITLRGTLGSCCIFSCSHETAFINAQMMLIRPHESLLPVYLHALLITSAFQSKLQSLGYGAAVRQLSSSQLSSLLIPVPPISMQLEFARRLDRALEVISSCDLRYEKINKLLHSIRMPAFSAIGPA